MTPRNILVLTLTAGLLSGCLSPHADTNRFYVLSTPPSAPSKSVESGRVFLVGLRMNSAEYLRTRQMMVEPAPNQIRLSDQNRWEETPQAGFARVLSERLAQNVPDCQLASMPLASTNTPEFDLEIELRSFQGRLAPKSEAEISAEIRILNANGRLVERDELRKSSPWDSASKASSYSALAAAESQAAVELADEIGQKVIDFHRKFSGR